MSEVTLFQLYASIKTSFRPLLNNLRQYDIWSYAKLSEPVTEYSYELEQESALVELQTISYLI